MEQDDTDPTGVRETSSSVQEATLNARHRKAAMATAMYVEKHKDLKTVAKKCGYPSANHALVAIEKYMDEQFREHPTSLSRMRDMAGRRLDNLLRRTAGKALDPDHPEHLAAVQQYRGIISDWVGLYGLRAPQQLIVSNPTSDAIMEVAMRIQMQGTPQLEQGDIFGDDADDSEIAELERRQAEAAERKEADAARVRGEEIVEGEILEDSMETAHG